MKRQFRDRETLVSEIASLSKLGIDELRERWKAMLGKGPSRDISRSFLTRAIAYRLQERLLAVSSPRPDACWPSWPMMALASRLWLWNRLPSCGPARCWCVNGAVSAIK
jgi:Protein of unknown function (DUF2924)